MTKLLDDKAVVRRLEKACHDAGGISAFAREHGFDREMVDAVKRGARPPAKTLLSTLGLRRVARYEALSLNPSADGDSNG